MHIGLVSLLVREYDEAITYFVDMLGFRVLEDKRIDLEKRWVVVGPREGGVMSLLLARANTSEQISRIGNQSGGRVLLFLYSDDFWGDYSEMTARGVEFLESPREEEYGAVVVFRDLYGNKWDLLESTGSA